MSNCGGQTVNKVAVWEYICRLYPTKENVARRHAEQEKKLNRGERLGENKNHFGRNSVSFVPGGTTGKSD